MGWRIEDADAVASDVLAIFDHLMETYLAFTEPVEDAMVKAQARVEIIRRHRYRLATAPHRGTVHEVDGVTYRNVTMDRAIYWFTLDEVERIVRVEGIFYGGQDHHSRMLDRLASGSDED